MARDAVGEVRDAFAEMLPADIGFGVLMATVAGVLPLIARRVARDAGCVVIPVEHEEARMIESRPLPPILAMAVRALAACQTAVDRGRGSSMARRAILPDRHIQQRMGERRFVKA